MKTILLLLIATPFIGFSADVITIDLNEAKRDGDILIMNLSITAKEPLKVLIADANFRIRVFSGDRKFTAFHPGMVLSLPYNSETTVDERSARLAQLDPEKPTKVTVKVAHPSMLVGDDGSLVAFGRVKVQRIELQTKFVSNVWDGVIVRPDRNLWSGLVKTDIPVKDVK